METEIIVKRNKIYWGRSFLSGAVASYFAWENIYKRLEAGVSSDMEQNMFLFSMLTLFGLFVFGLTIVSLLKLLKTTPALVINAKGITDNVSPVDAGLIRWKDIKDISLRKFARKMHLVIHLYDDKPFMDNLPGGFNGRLAIDCKKKTGSPIAINPNFAKFKPEELKEQILLMKNRMDSEGTI